MNKTKIVYLFPRNSSFVQKDIALLSARFEIEAHDFNIQKKALLPVSFLKQIFFLIKNARCKAIICMFAGYHSLLPGLFAKLTGKAFIVIAGGADSVSFPQFGYGNFRKPILAAATKFSYRMATFIAPVADALIHQEYTYLPESPGEQGIRHFTALPREKFVVIPNGYDAGFWNIKSGQNRRGCITVATHIESEARKNIKGIDLVLALAERMPDIPFCIAGCTRNELPEALSPNIRITGPLTAKELADEYNNALIYLQLSVSEGFPNALCEAMLCGCIPVVTPVGAMREIAGNDGFILEHKDANQAEQLIRKVLVRNNDDLQYESRKRIESKYTETNRKNLLSDLIQRAINR